MSSLEGYFVKTIGQNRGAPRVWLEGLQTEKAGFAPGARYDIKVQGQTVVLTANNDGTRVVSGKKIGERMNPVIDINSKELLAIFDGMSAVRVGVKKGEIYLVPMATELKKQERFKRLKSKLENGEALDIGSLSHGGGILSHAMHQGLANAGIDSRMAFANEIRTELLDHASVHNDAWDENTIAYGAPMQELAFDERGLASVPRTELFEIGMPCEASSLSGLAKRGHKVPEAQEHVGHLVVSSLIILTKANPAVVAIECVPNYFYSASAAILRTQLKELGYNVQETVLNGKEWGALENRDRWVMVATTHGIEFDLAQLMPPPKVERKLGDVLDNIPNDDPRWAKMEYLKDKAVRDAEAGKGFKMQLVTKDAEHVGTIGKGYAKRRSTEPFIISEEDPDLLRLLTPAEHARVKNVPQHLIEGLSDTVAHEVLGQSVIHSAFRGLGEHVGDSLNKVVGRAEKMPARPQVPSDVEHPDYTPEFTDLAKEVVATITMANTTRGQYSGAIVAVDKHLVIQDVGRNTGVVHNINDLDQQPKLGAHLKVLYEKGRGKVAEKAKPQLSLSL
jgi:DNA (cytosine-5)-methyltransferase 1